MGCLYNSTGYPVYTSHMVRGSGCYVYDDAGKKYLDLEAGVWCLPLGHMPPRLMLAIQEQMTRICHVGYKYNDEVAERAAAKLIQITKLADGQCVFLSSGSEAVEFGIQIAKALRPGKKCLCLSNQYLSAYGEGSALQTGKECLVAWKPDEEKTVEQWREELLNTFHIQKIGVFVLEAGNSSGLVHLPPVNLMCALNIVARENHVLLVVDEVTSGIGRTGKWFGYMHFDIRPDIVALGKGLGNGYPVSAVVMSKEIADGASDIHFHYAQSHQNDPLGCRIALEVITEVEEKGLIQQAVILGQYLREGYVKISEAFPLLKEIKGIGLLTAILFSDNVQPEQLEWLDRQLFEAGYIVGMKPAQRTLRTYAPLVLKQNMIDDYLAALAKLLRCLYT